MSGGSMNYAYLRIGEIAHDVSDLEIAALLLDLSTLLRNEEWWRSGDYEKEAYLDSLHSFKRKWLGAEMSREERLKGIVDDAVEELRKSLLELISTNDK